MIKLLDILKELRIKPDIPKIQARKFFDEDDNVFLYKFDIFKDEYFFWINHWRFNERNNTYYVQLLSEDWIEIHDETRKTLKNNNIPYNIHNRSDIVTIYISKDYVEIINDNE